MGDLRESEMDHWLDLRPFMQRTPFVLQGNASMARAYRLFRTLGLHHMFVGSPKPPVIGMLTRKVRITCFHTITATFVSHVRI